jgi:predicted ATPase
VREDLPRGTVTFVFTDVEGSTRLLHELGAERYADALAEHRRVIREACLAQWGVEVDTQGDAFFFAFPTAPGALAAASALTEALASGPIRVRVGVHTGTPHLSDEGYVGGDVHRAARIAASGHGGQVLVSAATAALVVVDSLRDLGEHRFKDLSATERVYQLGDDSFPPLKTISNTNLPRPVSSFIGRDRERAEIVARIREGVRLLTLTGPGGSGKTRLALEAAGEVVPDHEDGVFWVGLAELRDPALVTETIARTLGAEDGLVEHIGDKGLFLLLDNLEQVVEAAPELSTLLGRCPNLTLLVTSRELLRVEGEVEYPVLPLAAPEAIALFCERTKLEISREVGELCARLDNLPLAVELAAARTKALSPAQILQRLSQRLDLLKGGRDADPRQQTLRATIEWSYDLLSPAEQVLFARLSIFAGGSTLEAAEEVCAAEVDDLQSLAEKSLLRVTNERYWMLETIREFARERLEAMSDARQIARLHATRYARMVLDLYPSLRDYSTPTLRTLREEQENLRAALGFACDEEDASLAGDLVYGLWFYWLTTGSGTEARGWAERYLATPRAELPPLDRYPGDLGAAEIFRFTDEAAVATGLKREMIGTGRSHPDAIVHGAPVARSTAATLSDLSYIELDAGNVAEARALAEEALELRHRLGHPRGIAHATLALASIAYFERDWVAALDLFRESVRGFEAGEASADALGTKIAVAECQLLLDRSEEAAALLKTVVPRLRELGDQTFDVYALRVAGMVFVARGNTESAALLFGAADSKIERSGMSYFGVRDEEVYGTFVRRVEDDLGGETSAFARERGAALPDGELFDLARLLD